MIKSPLPHPLIKQLQRDVISQRLYSDLIMIHEALIEKIEEIKKDIESKVGPRGPKGDEPSDERIISLFSPYIPDIVNHIKSLIPELKDGHTPTDKELLKLIEPVVKEQEKILESKLAELAKKIPVKGLDLLNEEDYEQISKFTLSKIKPSEIDPTKILDDIMKLPQGKKISTKHIDGLDQTITAIQNQLRKGYLHGSGVSSISAGSGIVLTTTSDGGYQISTSSSGTIEIPAEAPDGVITAFTSNRLPLYVISEQGTAIEGFGYTLSGTGPYTVTMTIPPVQFIRIIY